MPFNPSFRKATPASVNVFSRASAHIFLASRGSKLSHVSALLKAANPGGFNTNPNIKGGNGLEPYTYSMFIIADLPIRQKTCSRLDLFVHIVIVTSKQSESLVTAMLSLQFS